MDSSPTRPSPNPSGNLTVGSDATTFLTFHLGEELFAMDVAFVREILELCPITPVPASPPHMLGVVNVRGIATAVMDLRTRFGITAARPPVDARIIIMELEDADECIVVGGLADSVREVIELDPGQIKPAPTLAMNWRNDQVLGAARHGGRHLILLDIARLLLDRDESSPSAEPPSPPQASNTRALAS